jgi:hypothetical protein
MNKHDNDTKKTEKENCRMPKIIIDEQFKALLPALDEQTYAMLEESLVAHGCMNPLVLWNGIPIDGHNRYEICKKHKIHFHTVDKEFGSRDEALIRIISRQVARRNLTALQLSYFRGVHYNADKRLITNKAGLNQYPKEVERHSDVQPQSGSTAKRLSEQYNVSPKTIDRDAQTARAIDAIGASSPEAKRDILSGAVGIDRKYLRKLAAGPEDEIKETAASIAEGTFARRKTASEPDVSAAGVMEAFNAAIDKMADEFELAIERLKDELGEDELKTALRKHIDKLEGLYSRI